MTVAPRMWPGATVVCIGGGPSLTADDVDAVRGHARVIAVNDAYRLAPWADVLYACDDHWWGWHPAARAFAGWRYSLTPPDPAITPRPGIRYLRNTGPTGLERDPSGLRTGRNSGYQAINLAVHFGATRIVLLGYDQRLGPDGAAHWFGDHPEPTPTPYADHRQTFHTLIDPLAAAGVVVVNASRRTALTAFPIVRLDDEFPAAGRVSTLTQFEQAHGRPE